MAGQQQSQARTAEGASARLFRPTLDGLRPFDHGPSLEAVRALCGDAEIYNLTTNENAFGPSPRVADAVREAAEQGWNYPDPQCGALRAAVAERLGVAPYRLMFGCGSEALLEFIVRACAGPGDEVLVAPPTFPIYATYAAVVGAETRAVARDDHFRIAPEAVAAALTPSVRALFLCNPNNPTGTPIPPDEIEAIARAVGGQCLVVVDEAYHEFAALDAPQATLAALDRAGARYVVLRTFSKAFGLGGYRVGYGVASDAQVVSKLDLVRTQFGVGALSQVAALAAWQDAAHLSAVVRRSRAAVDALSVALRAQGWEVLPSAANFVFLRTRGAAAVARHLLARGIIVRTVGDLGVRITVGTDAANAALVAALADGPA